MTSREAAIAAFGLEAVEHAELIRRFQTLWGLALEVAFAEAVGGRVGGPGEADVSTERGQFEFCSQANTKNAAGEAAQRASGRTVVYITADAVELYAALGDLALDCLKPGGVLAAMVWPPMLVDVVKALDRPGLAYRWSIVWQFTTHNNTGHLQRRIYDMTKLVLLYHRDAMPADAPYLTDLVQAVDAEKDLHVWQQDLSGFTWLIERLTWPGDLICDPFVGSGTTAVAALRAERQFIGCDLDPAAVEITRKRLEL